MKLAAIEASSGDKDTLTCAVLSAEQSLAPSPHIKVVNPSFFNESTNKALCSGAIRANTLPFFNIKRKASWALLNDSSLFFLKLSFKILYLSKVMPVSAIPKVSSLLGISESSIINGGNFSGSLKEFVV